MARPTGKDASGSSDEGVTARDLAIVLQALTGRPVDSAEQGTDAFDCKPAIVSDPPGAFAQNNPPSRADIAAVINESSWCADNHRRLHGELGMIPPVEAE